MVRMTGIERGEGFAAAVAIAPLRFSFDWFVEKKITMEEKDGHAWE
jgi:hypothetical protein